MLNEEHYVTGDAVRFIAYGWAVRRWMVGHEAEVIRPRTRGGLVEVRLNDADARQYGKPYISVHRECIRSRRDHILGMERV